MSLTAADLRFQESDHSFWFGDRRVPSVGRRLQAAGLLTDYGNVNPIVLEHARERGKHVEECAQLWAEGVLDEASVHPEALPYLDAFKRAVRQHEIADLRWQVVGYCADDDTMGIADLLCTVQGVPSVLDLKCTYRLERHYRLQLTAYQRQHLWDAEGYLGHRSRYILHLQKRGSFQLLDCDAEERREQVNDAATWEAVVALARWKEAGSPGGLRETGGSQRTTAERTTA